MKVLQVACGFSYSAVYKNLFNEFVNKKIDIDVYAPQHTEEKELNISIHKYPIYSNQIILPIDKILYFTKIFRMVKDVEQNMGLEKIDLIHAHSLFSDGAVAYELYKKYKIPYIVAVRNTDINKYYKYAKHLRNYARNILKNSSKIIFLSSNYQKFHLEKYVPKSLKEEFYKKSMIIPNGIHSYWIDNISGNKNKLTDNKLKLISVGVIDKNKNALKTVEACLKLISKYDIEIELTLIGKIKDVKYFNQLIKHPFVRHIEYLPKEKLIKLYRSSNIYIMPSKKETFGLVYAEAISQGLPVIYTRGQGFDGQFDEGVVGFNTSSQDAEEISSKILYMKKTYLNIVKDIEKNAKNFDWSIIADKYIDLYNSNKYY